MGLSVQIASNNYVKMRPFGGALTYMTPILLSLSEEGIRTQTTHTGNWEGVDEGGPARTQGDGRLQAQQRGLRRQQPCRCLGWGLPASRTVGRHICVAQSPPSVVPC